MHTVYHMINSDPDRTRSKQQFQKNLKMTFASLSKSTDKKEKEEKRKAIAKCFALQANALNRDWHLFRRVVQEYFTILNYQLLCSMK